MHNLDMSLTAKSFKFPLLTNIAAQARRSDDEWEDVMDQARAEDGSSLHLSQSRVRVAQAASMVVSIEFSRAARHFAIVHLLTSWEPRCLGIATTSQPVNDRV